MFLEFVPTNQFSPGRTEDRRQEKRLAEGPVITVPTITLEGDANGAPHPDASSYAKKFSGKYTPDHQGRHRAQCASGSSAGLCQSCRRSRQLLTIRSWASSISRTQTVCFAQNAREIFIGRLMGRVSAKALSATKILLSGSTRTINYVSPSTHRFPILQLIALTIGREDEPTSTCARPASHRSSTSD